MSIPTGYTILIVDHISRTLWHIHITANLRRRKLLACMCLVMGVVNVGVCIWYNRRKATEQINTKQLIDVIKRHFFLLILVYSIAHSLTHFHQRKKKCFQPDFNKKSLRNRRGNRIIFFVGHTFGLLQMMLLLLPRFSLYWWIFAPSFFYPSLYHLRVRLNIIYRRDEAYRKIRKKARWKLMMK